MSPLSANAHLCHLWIRSSGDRSEAAVTYHSLVARRNEFGVAESRFGRGSPMEWLRTPSA